MRHALGICGVLAAGVLLAVSAAMNWRFGLSLGMTETDGQIYGAASAAADCLKALIPFFLFAAIRNKMWSQAAASAIVWVVVTGYSLTSAFGHAALNRDGTAGLRVAEAQTYQDLRADIDRAQEQLSWVPKHRPAQTVQAELDSLKTSRVWKWTKGCTKVKGKYKRTFCEDYHGKVSELASADQAASLEARIASVRAKLGNTAGVASKSAADPQIAAFKELTGLDASSIRTAMLIFIALLLEIGSGLGLYVAFSQWRIHEELAPAAPKVAQADTVAAAVAAPEAVVTEEPRSVANDNKSSAAPVRLVAPENDVERFYREGIETKDGSTLTVASIYEEYLVWCESQNKEPLALPIFAKEFRELGVKREKIAGKVHYRGIALKKDGTLAGVAKKTAFNVKAA